MQFSCTEAKKLLIPTMLSDASVSLSRVLECPAVVETLCIFSPSFPVRIGRVSKSLQDLFPDDKLSQLLPHAFEKLGLIYSNPFLHCRSGDYESVWLMLVHGVDPLLVDHNGETLLQAAIQSGSIPLVHMLIERGCSLSSKGAFGYTALHQVAYTPFVPLCKFLLENRANSDALSRNGSTPLLIAAREGHTPVVQCMLAHGSDPNDGGDKGLTPLLMASAEGHLDTVRLLLAYKADATESVFEGRTPLHEAAEAGHVEVCRELICEGHANIHAPDREGVTPLMIAAKQAELLRVMAETEFNPKTPPSEKGVGSRLPPAAALAN